MCRFDSVIMIVMYFFGRSCIMLWPLLILGCVVLVTSRASPSTADEILDDVTWRQLPAVLRQESLQRLSSYNNPESPGPGIKIDYCLLYRQFFSFVDCVASNNRITVVNELRTRLNRLLVLGL
jgi:hypothetical protein